MTVYCIPRCASLPCNLTCSSFPAAHQVRYELQLHELSTIADGEDQAQKGTQLLEIYALEIQMYNETKNYKKLKVRSTRVPSVHRALTDELQEIYNASNSIRSAIPHPRIMGVIKECGGKMWMGER